MIVMNSEILRFLWLLLIFDHWQIYAQPSCSITSSSLLGHWIQPGLPDLVFINQTCFSSKGVCLEGQEQWKNKYIFYNESIRCKRCIFFISRHLNILQYRESECFDMDDDDHSRICATITPDTVLYTLFRDQASSIPCPINSLWTLKYEHQRSSRCQPTSLHPCISSDTFQLSYASQCSSERHIIGTCFARFSEGNLHYYVARRINPREFLCFSLTKMKADDDQSMPHEVYLSDDERCHDFLTRDSSRLFRVVRNQSMMIDSLPHWMKGTWSSIGNQTSFHFHPNEMIQTIYNDEQTREYQWKFLQILRSKQGIVRLRAQTLDQCALQLSCLKFVLRSASVIDLSIGLDEHGCHEADRHFTLFRKPENKLSKLCPHLGVYKSSENYSPISSCSSNDGLATLSIGCDGLRQNQFVLSASCPHDLLPDVQVITSISGICLASWRTDHRFQRTLIVDEQNKAFCLIQPLRPKVASWIVSDLSCTHLNQSSIRLENSFRYIEQCEEQRNLFDFSSSTQAGQQRSNCLLIYFLFQIRLYINVIAE